MGNTDEVKGDLCDFAGGVKDAAVKAAKWAKAKGKCGLKSLSQWAHSNTKEWRRRLADKDGPMPALKPRPSCRPDSMEEQIDERDILKWLNHKEILSDVGKAAKFGLGVMALPGYMAGKLVGHAANAVGDAAGVVYDTVGDAANAVGDAAGALYDTVGDAADAVCDTVGDAADAVYDTVGDAADAVYDTVGDAAKYVKNKTKCGLKKVTKYAHDKTKDWRRRLGEEPFKLPSNDCNGLAEYSAAINRLVKKRAAAKRANASRPTPAGEQIDERDIRDWFNGQEMAADIRKVAGYVGDAAGYVGGKLKTGIKNVSGWAHEQTQDWSCEDQQCVESPPAVQPVETLQQESQPAIEPTPNCNRNASRPATAGEQIDERDIRDWVNFGEIGRDLAKVGKFGLGVAALPYSLAGKLVGHGYDKLKCGIKDVSEWAHEKTQDWSCEGQQECLPTVQPVEPVQPESPPADQPVDTTAPQTLYCTTYPPPCSLICQPIKLGFEHVEDSSELLF